MNNSATFAIDFGTDRIKAAYFDSESATPRLIKLRADCFAIPALFYVERDSEGLYVGETAERRIQEDPRGGIELLKISIPNNTHWDRDGSVKEKWIRRNGRQLKPSDLLAHLFKELRMRIEAEISSDAPLNRVTLTITAAYSRKESKILEIAAEKTGFKKDAVNYLAEPEAAATEWIRQIGDTEKSVKDLIVLDCGGGTLDIAYLYRSEAGIFKVFRDERGHLSPKGFPIGGCNIDEELLITLRNKLPEPLRQEVERETILYRKEVRKIKELFSNEEPIPPIRIRDRNIELTENEIEEAIKDKFIKPACNRLAPYVTTVKNLGRPPSVLLVGGGAKLKGLAITFENEFQCEIFSDWDHAEFATVLGASCPSPYESGMENFKKQDYNAAISAFKRAIELDPLDKKVHTGLGQAHYQRGEAKRNLGQDTDAIADFTAAIRINPNHDDAYYNRANTKCNLGQDTDAIADYDAAIRINPNHDDAYYNRGIAKRNLGQDTDAIADFTAAIRINPNHDDAYYNRANTKCNLGQDTDAIADYDAAIRINPNHDDAYYNRGIAKRNLGQDTDAIADYDAAIRINPNHDDAYYNRGIAKRNLGQDTDAIADYDAAIRINPNHDDAYYNRANTKEEILKRLSKKHPKVLRELEALSSILLKLTAKPKRSTVLEVLPRLLEKCVVDLSAEYFSRSHVYLKECEDVLLANLREYYLNSYKQPFKFKNGELRLTSRVFWHSVMWDLKPAGQVEQIAKQLEEYSRWLINFIYTPDLSEQHIGSAHFESLNIEDFFQSHRERFKCLKRLAETPDNAEQKKQFWSLEKKAASSLKSIVDRRIQTLAKTAEVSESLGEFDTLLNGAFNASAVDLRLPEDAYKLFEIGGTNGLFRFVDATAEAQTEIETRLSNLYTLNSNIWLELEVPLNQQINKDRIPHLRDLKAFFDYFELDCPQKVTQAQAVLMIL